MNYMTKGEFVQALKDYHYIEELLSEEAKHLDDLNYLRFGKVKSSLDYDIVGYDRNGNVLRQIKGRSSVNRDAINESNEKLDVRITLSQRKLDNYRMALEKCDSELNIISEPLKEMLTLRYREHYKLHKLCKHFKKLNYDESAMYKYMMRELDRYYTPRN